MRKIDYYAHLMKYSISQLRDKEGYKELCEGIAELFNSLQKGAFELESWNNIDDAEGELLDFIGYLFGVYRGYFDLSKYFCLNRDDLNQEKLFYFEKGSAINTDTQGGLTDREMRQRIKGVIARLYSRKTRNDNIRVIKFLTFAEHVIITRIGTMQQSINLIGKNIFLTDKTFDEIEGVLADGVSLEHLYINGE